MRVLTLPSLLVFAAVAAAAPALGDKPPKWEYAELTYRALPGRPVGVDADGKEVPAVPASVSIRWVTGTAEVEVKSWDELAEKLRAPAMKKGTAAFQKIQMLNCLGADGWELMEQQSSSVAAQIAEGGFPGRGPGDRAAGFPRSSAASTWLLKRRVLP
jgi:hypothetical protein